MNNWKTTLIGAVVGAIGAAISAIIPLIQGGTVDWKVLGGSAAFAILGYFSKDHDVTGGTVRQ